MTLASSLIRFVFTLAGILALAGSAAAQISPFDGLRWVEEKPEVQLGDTWYSVISLEGKEIDAVLAAAKEEFGQGMVQKRFREDLVDVMALLDVKLNKTIDLVLVDLASGEVVVRDDVPMTRDKRQALRRAADNGGAKKALALALSSIPAEKALKDVRTLRKLLEAESSYLFLHGDGALEGFRELENELESSEPIPMEQFHRRLTHLMGLIGDRHSSVRFEMEGAWAAKGNLPFYLAPIFEEGGMRAAALVPKSRSGALHVPYDEEHPYLIAINGQTVEDWVAQVALRARHAPAEARWSRTLREMDNFADILRRTGQEMPEEITITLGDGKNTIDKVVSLSDQPAGRWRAMDEAGRDDSGPRDIAKKIDKNLGYLRIPEMWGKRRNPEHFKALQQAMQDLKKTRALIIDLRHNPGGVRDVLMELAPYFMAPDAEPWVANMARVRTDETFAKGEAVSGMEGRYLLPRDSQHYDEADRASIDRFMKHFQTDWKYEPKRFSEPHFLVLKPKKAEGIYHYKKPVYLLVNERSFSAASVMTACLKGMGKVQIAGVRTDGSSGRSQRMALPESGLRVRLSTMISFQRNGKTLDGNGTEPDLFLPVDLRQACGTRDTQLQGLVKHLR